MKPNLITEVVLTGLELTEGGALLATFSVAHEGHDAPPSERVTAEIEPSGGMNPLGALDEYFDLFHRSESAPPDPQGAGAWKVAQLVDEFVARLFEGRLLDLWISSADYSVHQFPRSVGEPEQAAELPTVAGDPVDAALDYLRASGFIRDWRISPTDAVRSRYQIGFPALKLPVPIAVQSRVVPNPRNPSAEFTVTDTHLALWKESENKKKNAALKGLLLLPTVSVEGESRLSPEALPITYVAFERLFHAKRLLRTTFRSSGGGRQSVTLVLEKEASGHQPWRLRTKGTKAVLIPLTLNRGVLQPTSP